MQSLFVIDSGKLAAAFEESFVMRAISDCEQRQGQWSETDYFCIPFIASSFVFIFSVPSRVNSKIWQTAKSVFFYCHSTVRKPSCTSDHWTNDDCLVNSLQDHIGREGVSFFAPAVAFFAYKGN